MLVAERGPYCPWLRRCGEAARPRRWSLHDRLSLDWLLVAVVEGEEWIEIEAERTLVPSGEGFLLAPGTVFSRGSEYGSSDWFVHAHLAYRADRDRAPEDSPPLSAADERLRAWIQPDAKAVFGHPLPLRFPEVIRPRLVGKIRGIVVTWQRDPERRLAIHDAISEFFTLLVEYQREQTAPGADLEQRIRRAERMIGRSLGQDPDIPTMAAAAGLKPSRFHQVYKQLRGTTPHQYIKRLRLIRAAAALRDPNHTIASAAATVGYRDPTVFARAFKQFHGLSPSDWRERYQREGISEAGLFERLREEDLRRLRRRGSSRSDRSG